jgi:hypothetical protein
MANKQNYTLKKAMIAALEKSLCVVTTACKQVGIERKTHYNWMNNDPEYKKAVDDLQDITLGLSLNHNSINKLRRAIQLQQFFY